MQKSYKKEEVKAQPQTLVDNRFIKAGVEVTWTPGSIEWKGKKISYEVWSQIVAFFKDTQEKFKSEAQIRLYCHRETMEWKAWAYPQTARGMKVDELEDHPQKEVDLLQFGDDWIQLGTVHHHCDMSAFQSGTDVNDEINQEGVHITCGFVNREEITTDIRYSLRKSFFKIKIEDFIETEVPTGLAERVQSKVKQLMIHNTEQVEYPEQWMKNMIEEKKIETELPLDFEYNTKFEAVYATIQKKHGSVDLTNKHVLSLLIAQKVNFKEFEEYIKAADAFYEELENNKLSFQKEINDDADAVSEADLEAYYERAGAFYAAD